MGGWLVIRDTAGTQRVRLEDGEHTLGRSADNDVVIGAPFVSRHHARIAWVGDTPLLIDAGSTNGLHVDGQQVSEYQLAPGAVVEIRGSHHGEVISLHFVPDQPAATEPAPTERLPLSTTSPAAPAEELTGPPAGHTQLPESDTVITIGRGQHNDLVLRDPQVSRDHATLERKAGQTTLSDHSINGTFVNGEAIRQPRRLAPGDRIRISSFELVFDGQRLVRFDQRHHTHVDARNLRVVVGKNQCILHDVSFTVRPGQFVAILGGSGAGKSTLLDALNGFRPATSGQVLVNGRDYYREFAALRLMVGYVPQADVVHRGLPAERALRYAAELRLPPDTSARERTERVDQVLAEVDLTGRRSTEVSRMSGGEIKRVSIGVELLTQPSLFFLDEPTSGLDPDLEAAIMRLLRAQANAGRTVVLITHATQNIELCDALLFLAPGGYLAFYGPPRAALDYFQCPDYPSIYQRIKERTEQQGGAALTRAFQASAYGRVVETEAGAQPPGQDRQHNAQAERRRPAGTRFAAWRQLGTLTRRYAEITWRDRRNLVLLLLQAPIIAVLAASIARPETLLALPDAAGSRNLLIILSCSAVWLGAMNAAREIVKELPIYRRERMVGLSLGPYLTSKYVILGSLSCVQAAILIVGISWRVRLPDQGALLPGSLELFVTLCLSALAGLSMGLIISTVSNSPDRATTLVPVCLIPQIIFVVSNTTEGFSRILAALTFSHWSLQALGSTVDLGQFASGLAGLNPSDFTHTPEFLLSRWLILLAMTLACVAISFWLLKRHDGALL